MSQPDKPAEGAGRRRMPRERRSAAPHRPDSGSRAGQRAARRRASRRRRILIVATAVAAAVVGGSALLWIPGDAVQSAPPPPVPSQVRITSGATVSTAMWGRAAATSSYSVEYSRQVSFAITEEKKVSGNRLTLDSLDPGTTYFLRVVAINPEGKTSVPSPPVQFTTKFPSDAPDLSVKGASSTSVRARLKSTADDVSFETQLSTDKSFQEPKTLTGKKPKKVFTKLDMKTKYFVRTRVVDEEGLPQSTWSQIEASKPAQVAPLRVASFNVLKAARANWSARRSAVVDTITSSDIEVAGLQEATPRTVAGGVRQYMDIVRLLGPDWALTEDSKGATGEARTVYDRTRLDLIDQGYETVTGSTRFGVVRYITWAIFEQKSTQKRFVFINTHFATNKSRSRSAHRTVAAAQLVRVAKSVSAGRLPVIIAGDFNSAAYRNSSNGVYRTITGAGYVDPLGGGDQLGSAEKRINADLKTATKFTRHAARDATAPMIDNIFVSPMRVSEWETVAKLDGNDNYIGTIPSDHNMIRASLVLPKTS